MATDSDYGLGKLGRWGKLIAGFHCLGNIILLLLENFMFPRVRELGSASPSFLLPPL
jgi:hypothetical protein